MSAGKGDKWRKGTDYDKFRNSKFWDRKESEKKSEKKKNDQVEARDE